MPPTIASPFAELLAHRARAKHAWLRPTLLAVCGALAIAAGVVTAGAHLFG